MTKFGCSCGKLEIAENEAKKKRGIFRSLKDYFREYCLCSTIHGFSYFGERRTLFEKIWWAIVLTISVIGCVILIRQVYNKWERSPVIVSFATRETPIYDIPFAAVTICPESKSLTNLYNHTDILRKLKKKIPLTKIEANRFDYMSMICDEKGNYSTTELYSDDFFEQLDEIMVPMEVTFEKCEYMKFVVNCSKVFTPIMTDEGICYTFNMLDRSEIYKSKVKQYANFHKMPKENNTVWSMDNGYSDKAGISPHPRRALLSGAPNSLTVTLRTLQENVDYTCKGFMQGFRVMLHTPMRVPRPSQQYFRVPLNQFVIAGIQPVMIKTDQSVVSYNPIRRECNFPWERNLTYFQIYTQLNCKMECLTNRTLEECGCVNFYMPRDNSTPICGVGKMDCMKKTTYNLQYIELYNKLSLALPVNMKDTHCNCLPICNDLSYDVETSQSDWDWKRMHQDEEVENSPSPYKGKTIHQSQVTVYFKSTQFITYARQELYGPTDFLANFGGLLGLFTGFSVLSFMEIIYFLSVRLFCNTQLYGYWAGPEKKTT